MGYLTTRPSRALLPTVPTFRTEMNRLFDEFFTPTFLTEGQAWAPPLDVSETNEKVLVHAELPGVNPKDVHVELVGNVLQIRGEKKAEKERKDDNWIQIERSYGVFSRNILLPEGLDPDKIEATSHDGILKIEIAKSAAARPRQIQVKVS